VVVDATLELAPGDAAEVSGRDRQIVRWRRANQPGGANAGSVFTNPPDDHAGRLIDAAGCRGLARHRRGLPKHANFIQADAGGSADDVLALMREVQARVSAAFGVELHPETCIVGVPLRDGTDRP
jgi:UDP-N-acetylmuramate dehydrogenase